MVYESVILGFIFTLFEKLKNYYKDSFFARFIQSFSIHSKTLISNSSIWWLIHKKDSLSGVWEESIIYKFVNCMFNMPSMFCRKAFYRFKEIIQESLAFRVLKIVLSRFEIIISGFLFITLVVPHKYWDNIYSTMGALGIVFLYFVKIMIFRSERFNFKAIDVMLFIFFASTVMAEVTSVFPNMGIRFIIFYITCFLLVLSIVSSIKTMDSLETFLKILLIGVSITGLYGVWQSIIGVPVNPSLTDIRLNEGMPGRIFSTMENPNNYAEILVMMLPFYVAMVFNSKTFFGKLAFSLLAVPPLMALGSTGARSAWMVFIVSLFVFTFFKNRKLFPVVLVLGLLSIPFIPDFIIRRLATVFNAEDTSGQYRVQIYQTVWPMLKDYWITGVGLGTDTFMKLVQRYYLFTKSVPLHTHNLFLEIWMETGILGFISFTWSMARIIKKCMLNIFRRTDQGINHILMAGAAAMIGILLMNLVEYSWYYPRVMLFFWMLIGIILAGLNIISKKGEEITAET